MVSSTSRIQIFRGIASIAPFSVAGDAMRSPKMLREDVAYSEPSPSSRRH
uniref:Uncharacterized protein n=1 Tax=Desertifilum tharense IPPAS B-1220 TaxID=1781255 RepID=A0ACD5GUR1_9CYAN